MENKQFTAGVLNATLDLAALVLVGAAAFLGSEVVLAWLPSCAMRKKKLSAKKKQLIQTFQQVLDQITRFNLSLLKLFGVYAGVILNAQMELAHPKCCLNNSTGQEDKQTSLQSTLTAGQQVCCSQEAREGCRQGRSDLATERGDKEACGSTRECRTFAEWLKFEFALKNQRGLGTNGDAGK